MPTASRSVRSGTAKCGFHTDKCYHRRPHRATFLYGIDIPSEGGHTKFSSMYAAYDKVRPELKEPAQGAMVIQGQEYGVGSASISRSISKTSITAAADLPHQPGSGRKGLYVATLRTPCGSKAWTATRARAAGELFDIAEDPAIIYEHVWRAATS